MPWIIRKNDFYLRTHYPVNYWRSSINRAEVFEDEMDAQYIAWNYDAECIEIEDIKIKE